MLAIFLDTETTGLDPLRHQVVEIAFKIVDINHAEVKCQYYTIVKQPEFVWDRRDLGSVEINGFTWEMVNSGKEPFEVRQDIITLFKSLSIERGKAVFICQNPGFDRTFFLQLIDVYTQDRLNWPYHWLDLASMFWSVENLKCIENGQPFPEALSLSKNEIAKFYGLPSEAEPHRALNGVNHLIQCYQAMFKVKFQEKGQA